MLDLHAMCACQVPPTRSDILHACDVVEDVAIAYGFNNIPKRVRWRACMHVTSVHDGGQDGQVQNQRLCPCCMHTCIHQHLEQAAQYVCPSNLLMALKSLPCGSRLSNMIYGITYNKVCRCLLSPCIVDAAAGACHSDPGQGAAAEPSH